ncbi:hypothetical protein N8470_00660 [bacterium]|nr:hypothetical protein [bacterium]
MLTYVNRDVQHKRDIFAFPQENFFDVEANSLKYYPDRPGPEEGQKQIILKESVFENLNFGRITAIMQVPNLYSGAVDPTPYGDFTNYGIVVNVQGFGGSIELYKN